ncbi:hypothetical protein C1H46_024046 [Malus baccata]|uniref:Uncharacterized protein n=1 Tax=Malus baccata TaxID=106549 RepID=A0A540LVQ8_MALBA|nr:hypothetical protein C1H46_024046 [Malus baccata]
MFNRNPRQLRYNRLGRDEDEADVDKIIDMANKASIADQQIQVQENIHLQIKNFCVSMDEVLLPNVKKINEGTESPKQSNAATRRSAFSFAIGRSGPPVKHHVMIFSTEVPEKRPLERTDVSQKLYDGTVINAQPWGYGGETRDFWDGLTVPETRPSKQRDEKGRDRIWRLLKEVKMKRFGSFWFKLGGSKNSGSDVPVLKSLVLVATRALCDEVVLLNYTLSNSNVGQSGILLLMRRKTEGGGAKFC